MNNTHRLKVWRDALSPITDFRREFDRLFDDLSAPVSARGLRSEHHFVPPCDVQELDGHYLLTLEMAGVKKDEICIEVVDHQLVVRGDRRSETQSRENGNSYSERRFGRFHRTFSIPPGVDTGQIEARYEDGLLHIVVPKEEEAKPRQIKIATGNTGSGFFGRLLNPAGKEREGASQLKIDEKIAF